MASYFARQHGNTLTAYAGHFLAPFVDNGHLGALVPYRVRFS
jgi:hypothetical protein